MRARTAQPLRSEDVFLHQGTVGSIWTAPMAGRLASPRDDHLYPGFAKFLSDALAHSAGPADYQYLLNACCVKVLPSTRADSLDACSPIRITVDLVETLEAQDGRASSGLAGSRSNSRPIRAIFSTCSALLLPSHPARSKLSSRRPARCRPCSWPGCTWHLHSPTAPNRPVELTHQILAELYMNWRFSKCRSTRMPMTHCSRSGSQFTAFLHESGRY